MNKEAREIEKLIEESRPHIEDEDYQGAIENLEQALEIIKQKKKET